MSRKHLEIALGRDVGVLNGATEGSNTMINELKAETTQAKLKTTSERLSEALREILIIAYCSFLACLRNFLTSLRANSDTREEIEI